MSLFFLASFVTFAREKASLKVSNFFNSLFSFEFKKLKVDGGLLLEIKELLFFVIDPDKDDMVWCISPLF